MDIDDDLRAVAYEAVLTLDPERRARLLAWLRKYAGDRTDILLREASLLLDTTAEPLRLETRR